MQEAPMLAGMPEDVLTPGTAEASGAMPRGSDAQAPPPPPRLRRADRTQIRLLAQNLDQSLAPDHPVRTIWAIVSGIDTSAFEASLVARGSDPGRAPPRD